MPPTRARNTFCFAIDALTDRKWVKNVVDQILVHNSWSLTNNDAFLYVLNCSHPSLGFETAFDMDNGVILEKLDSIEEEWITQTDWLEGVRCATALFKNLNDARIFTYQIILISDFRNFNSNVGDNREIMKEIIEAMNELDIRLTVGTNRNISFGQRENLLWRIDDVSLLMDHIQISDSNEATTQCLHIVKQVRGMFCSEELLLDWISFLSNGIPAQNWRERLTLDKLQFNTVTRKIIRSTEPIAKNAMIKRRLHCVKSTSTVVEEDDVIKGYNFLGKFLTLPEDVKRHLKTNGKRCFKIVGFIEQDKLPDVYFGGPDVYSVQADAPETAAAFNAFVKAVSAKRRYALVVRIYNNGNAPRLFILIPHTNYFIMVALVRSVPQYLSHTHSEPITDGEKPSNAIMMLRQHLVSTRKLLHPSAEAGLWQKLIVDNMRRLVGYNMEGYESNATAFLSELRQIDSGIVAALDQHFCDDKDE